MDQLLEIRSIQILTSLPDRAVNLQSPITDGGSHSESRHRMVSQVVMLYARTIESRESAEGSVAVFRTAV